MEKVKDLSDDDRTFLGGAKAVLEERFGHTEWSRSFVPALLGLCNFRCARASTPRMLQGALALPSQLASGACYAWQLGTTPPLHHTLGREGSGIRGQASRRY